MHNVTLNTQNFLSENIDITFRLKSPTLNATQNAEIFNRVTGSLLFSSNKTTWNYVIFSYNLIEADRFISSSPHFCRYTALIYYIALCVWNVCSFVCLINYNFFHSGCYLGPGAVQDGNSGKAGTYTPICLVLTVVLQLLLTFWWWRGFRLELVPSLSSLISTPAATDESRGRACDSPLHLFNKVIIPFYFILVSNKSLLYFLSSLFVSFFCPSKNLMIYT